MVLQEDTALLPTKTIQEPANPMLPLPPMLAMDVNQDAPRHKMHFDRNGQQPPPTPPQPQAIFTT